MEAGKCERSLQIDYDEHVFNMARQEIFDLARSTDNRPFMLHVSFTHPHNPFVTTQEFWDLYDHSKIPAPEVPFIPYEKRDPWSQRYFMTIRQDEFDITNEQLINARHAYFAMTSYFDLTSWWVNFGAEANISIPKYIHFYNFRPWGDDW